MTKRKRIAIFTLTAVLVALIIGQMLLSMLIVRSEAATTNQFYTDVFDDLSKDESFDPANYPRMTLDYYLEVNSDEDKTNDQAFMEVIQIAESTSGELYIYVYQPTHQELDLKARYVSLSTEYSRDGQNIYPDPYDLVLVSEYGVFDKYVVKDFEVSKDTERYYNIVMLERDFSDKIDEKIPGTEDEGNYVGVGVGQQWYASYVNDKLIYEMNTFETVEVEIKFSGNLDLQNGIEFANFGGTFNYADLWFVVFDVEDYIVKHIYDGDLRYKERSVQQISGFGGGITTGSWSDFKEITLTDVDEGSFTGTGLFGSEFSWKSISSARDFLSSVLTNEDVELTDELLLKLYQNLDSWVFTFALTESTLTNNGQAWFYTDIDHVSVFRLHFMDVYGRVYNLGAVSDMVNPDNKADGSVSGHFPSLLDLFPDLSDLWETIKFILEVIALILLIVIFLPILIPLFSIFFNVLIYLIKMIIYPFKMLASVLNNHSNSNKKSKK